MKIAVLDDSVDNLNLIKLYTKKLDNEIYFESNPNSFLEYLKNNEVDVLFLDIQMPEMDGFEVLEEVRKIKEGVFVCALTAFSFESELEKIRSSSFDDFLQKPILRNDFLKYIEDFESRKAS